VRSLPHEAEDDKACAVAANLSKRLAIDNDDDTDVEEKLDRLEDVDTVARSGTKHPKSNVAIRLERVTIGVHGEKNLPEQESTANIRQHTFYCVVYRRYAKAPTYYPARAPKTV
jgi:hypothetical protein